MLSWYAILVFACAAPPAASAPATALPEPHLNVSPYRHPCNTAVLIANMFCIFCCEGSVMSAQFCDRIQHRLMAVSRTRRLSKTELGEPHRRHFTLLRRSSLGRQTGQTSRECANSCKHQIYVSIHRGDLAASQSASSPAGAHPQDTHGKGMLSGHTRKCAHVVQQAASAQPRMRACTAQMSGLEPLAVGDRREDMSADKSSHHTGYFSAHPVSMCGPIRSGALPCARSTVGASDTTHLRL